VRITLLFSSRWSRTILYVLLFALGPLFLFYLKLGGRAAVGWPEIFACSGVMTLPAFVIVVIGTLTRRKFVNVLDSEGALSGSGRVYFWKDLYYVDRISKYRQSRKVKDNQLHLVFAVGVAIIPPLIHDRDKVWALINSIPVQFRVDGKIVTS